jgi:predicted Zn-dependent protease
LSGYITSRQTGRRAGIPSCGCAVAPDADDHVRVRVPHVAIAASDANVGLNDLCRGITKGLLVRNTRDVSVDSSLASGMMRYSGALLEIARGKIVGRIDGNGIQFNTNQFWRQSLNALGGASTTELVARQSIKGQPSTRAWASASAPAGLFKDVDVLSTRIRL